MTDLPSSISSNNNNGFLSMGLDTFKISLKDVFEANRLKLVQKLRQEQNGTANGVVYLVGGPSLTRNDTDHEPLFRQESYFTYLVGVKEPDCAVCIEVDTGRTTLFIPRLPPEYATFMGRIKSCQEWQNTYQVHDVRYTDEAEAVLQEILKKCVPPEKINGYSSAANGHEGPAACSSPPKLLLMEGRNSDSGNLYKAPKMKSSKLASLSDTSILFPVLAECRVIKSDAELLVMQHVTELTSMGHVYVMRNTNPNTMEYQSESLFRHYCYYNHGCRLVGYTPICGCGPNSAVLHYGHTGEPNARLIQDGDMLLFDMGAEYFGYGSDVTCSFPASGKFSDLQKPIYNAVLDAQRAVYERLGPGVSWVDCHKAAEAAILAKLIEIGLVVPHDNTIEELVDLRLGAVFMPHGLGHFVGIDTHDVGGYLPGHPERIMEPGLKSLRTARVLQPNMVLTVEPGCYFIDHLLEEASKGELKQYLNISLLQKYRGFGGVRLEDVVQITENGFVNYTICPRTVSEVEHVMSGGKWPPLKDDAPELGRIRLCDPNPLAVPSSLSPLPSS